MRRFQMMIDDELDAALERRADELGVSKAELLRRFARDRLAGRADPLEDDALWSIVGVAAEPDTPRDRFSGRVSEHVDDVLYGRCGA